jgi:hypothetical protein
MLLEEDKHTEAGDSQKRRARVFGAKAAKRIRVCRDCQFSLLPPEELSRLATGWYEAAAEATLNGDFSPISEWVRRQARTSAEQNFELADTLELFRLCRTAAIEQEKWDQDLFSVVDDVINETLQSIRSEVSWEIPRKLNYLSTVASEEGSPASQVEAPRPATIVDAVVSQTKEPYEPWSFGQSTNRRDFARNRLRLPIRVTSSSRNIREVMLTENISRGGLYFLTRDSSYHLKMQLRVTYPYWTDPGAINKEYAAEVVRIDRRTDGWSGIAIDVADLSRRQP